MYVGWDNREYEDLEMDNMRADAKEQATEKPRSKRKAHNQDAGYIAQRKNALTGRPNVIYYAKEQGIDCTGKYAVVCDAHATLQGTTALPHARMLMKDATMFCEQCRSLA